MSTKIQHPVNLAAGQRGPFVVGPVRAHTPRTQPPARSTSRRPAPRSATPPATLPPATPCSAVCCTPPLMTDSAVESAVDTSPQIVSSTRTSGLHSRTRAAQRLNSGMSRSSDAGCAASYPVGKQCVPANRAAVLVCRAQTHVGRPPTSVRHASRRRDSDSYALRVWNTACTSGPDGRGARAGSSAGPARRAMRSSDPDRSETRGKSNVHSMTPQSTTLGFANPAGRRAAV